MSVFRDKAHILKLIKQHCGVYSIQLPVDDNCLYHDIIVDDTIPTFSTYYPRVLHVPANLNELRIRNDKENTIADMSNIYQLPPIITDASDRFIVGIESIRPFNDLRYQSVPSAYETIESFQALAVSQTVGDLASTMEPPFLTEFLPPNRFRVNNGTYYKDQVIIGVEVSYSTELYDIPMTLRQAFYKLALLDAKRYFWNQMKYWKDFQTSIASFNLQIDDWADAESKREELLEQWDQSFHLNRVAAVWC